MYRYLAITAIVIFIAGLFFIGYPLRPESTAPGYAERNPGDTARCFTIGDTDSYFQCMFWQSPRLAKMDLIHTVVDRINQNIYPGGYIFILGLVLFLLIACWLIIMMAA